MDPPPPNHGLGNCLFRKVVAYCGCVVVVCQVSPVPATLNKWKAGTRTAFERKKERKKKNIIADGWSEVEHHLDVCRATSGAHVEFVKCKTFLELL